MTVPAPNRPTVAYLGPEGTFTHAAALRWEPLGVPQPYETVGAVYTAVETGSAQFGVVAIESSVEGYVVPSLDEIVGAQNVVAIDEDALEIAFDAFIRPDGASQVSGATLTSGATPASGDPQPLQVAQRTQITAHPHGLAQCGQFVASSGLLPVPATSNAAACRDITDEQVALGPAICGDLYGLTTLARGVQDFAGARTRFLLITSRDGAQEISAQRALGAQEAGTQDPSAGESGAVAADGAGPAATWRTMLAVTPHEIGPGVLARITATFGTLRVNMTSLITRPLKAQEGTYVFVVTLDGAPWEPPLRALFERLLDAGDSLKTLGVFPARQMSDGAFDTSRVPVGSARRGMPEQDQARGLLW